MKDGEHIGYYGSGEILHKCLYLDGKLHGECIHYSESGEVEYKYYHIYHEPVTESEWLSYNRNLTLELL